MSFTFGANTTDDITITPGIQIGGDNFVGLFAGWFYPTTLTATRRYFSCGNTYGAEVDGTTSEIRMRTDNTTDGQWVTSGAGISTNKWWFVAWLNACENTTVAGAWRVWVGDAVTPPAAVTVTNPTARSGNYSSANPWTLGNAGATGSASWQGDIGWMACGLVSAPGSTNPLGVATSGVISDSEADLVLKRLVTPLWRGESPYHHLWQAPAVTAYAFQFLPLDDPSQVGGMNTQRNSDVPLWRAATGVNGVTYSANRPPTAPPPNWPLTPPFTPGRRG